MKRLLDIVISLIGLLLLAPLLISVMVLVWFHDFHSPLYIAPRIGRYGRAFNIIKLRSMVINADKSGVESTSSNDDRIIPVGRFIRRYKLDELSQLWNVLVGEMSLVGPRPNTRKGTDAYTDEEKKLLSIRPGITDLASIVFADEGEILQEKSDPDLAYSQLIRPWKSRLGLIYVEKNSIWIDIQIIFYTLIAVFSRNTSLNWVVNQLHKLKVDEKVVIASGRKVELQPFPPPGAKEIAS